MGGGDLEAQHPLTPKVFKVNITAIDMMFWRGVKLFWVFTSSPTNEAQFAGTVRPSTCTVHVVCPGAEVVHVSLHHVHVYVPQAL